MWFRVFGQVAAVVRRQFVADGVATATGKCRHVVSDEAVGVGPAQPVVDGFSADVARGTEPAQSLPVAVSLCGVATHARFRIMSQ